MNYLRKSSKKQSKLPNLLVLILVIIVLVINILDIQFPRRIAQKVTEPVVASSSFLKDQFGGFTVYFASKQSLANQVEDLEERVEGLQIALKGKNFVVEENKILREILSHTEGRNDLLTAKVLVRPPSSPYDTFVIDAGRSDGIYEGGKVYSNGVLIGRVEEMSVNSSIIRLLSSSGESTEVFLSDGITTKANGVGGGRLKIVLPKDLSVEVGSAVYIDEEFAPVLGIVQAVEKNEVSTFQTIHFNLPIDFSALRKVEVVK